MNVVVDTSMLLALTERGIPDRCPWTVYTTDMVFHVSENRISNPIQIKTFSPDEVCKLAVFHRQLQEKHHITFLDSSALFLAKATDSLLLTNDVQISNAAASVGVEAFGLQEVIKISKL